MNQPFVPGSTAQPEEPPDGADASSVPATDAAADLPAERSRFSRWLASFGLGETQIPLLRPLKGTRERSGQ